MDKKTDSTSSKHIAGIIPVAKVQTDIDLVVPTALLPIGNGFYNIQRAIVECCYAGCDTVWVVCEESEAAILKRVCGDFVLNMHDYERSKYSKFPSDNRRVVPIFYAPLSFKHQNKIGLGVSVMDGIHASFHVSSKISKWSMPHKYYVSSPYGVYSPEVNRLRTEIVSDGSFFLSHDGKTAIDGENLGFCLSVDHVKHCSYLFKKTNVKTQFSLDIILNNDKVKKNLKVSKIDMYHNIQNWEGYQGMWQEPLVIYPKYKFCFSGAYNKQERKLDV